MLQWIPLLFSGYGLIVLVLAVIEFFTKKESIHQLRLAMARHISWWGIMYLICCIIAGIKEGTEQWLNPWVQSKFIADLWLITIAILLRFRKISANSYALFGLSLLLLVNPHFYLKLAIHLNVAHRDYLPSSWTPADWFLNIVFRLLFAAVLFGISFWISQLRKNQPETNKTL